MVEMVLGDTKECEVVEEEEEVWKEVNRCRKNRSW